MISANQIPHTLVSFLSSYLLSTRELLTMLILKQSLMQLHVVSFVVDSLWLRCDCISFFAYCRPRTHDIQFLLQSIIWTIDLYHIYTLPRTQGRDHRIIPNSFCLQLYFSLMLDRIWIHTRSYRYIKNSFDNSVKLLSNLAMYLCRKGHRYIRGKDIGI